MHRKFGNVNFTNIRIAIFMYSKEEHYYHNLGKIWYLVYVLVYHFFLIFWVHQYYFRRLIIYSMDYFTLQKVHPFKIESLITKLTLLHFFFLNSWEVVFNISKCILLFKDDYIASYAFENFFWKGSYFFNRIQYYLIVFVLW